MRKIQDGRVKTFIVMALLFMMGIAAQAKLAPVETRWRNLTPPIWLLEYVVAM